VHSYSWSQALCLCSAGFVQSGKNLWMPETNRGMLARMFANNALICSFCQLFYGPEGLNAISDGYKGKDGMSGGKEFGLKFSQGFLGKSLK